MLKCCIHAADFTSVVVHGDHVYAATDDDQSIYIYEHDVSGNKWTKVHSFNTGLEGFVTLSVTNQRIRCCSVLNETVNVYSLHGELLNALDTCRHEGDSDGAPFICDDDESGRMLTVDAACGRVQVLNEQGEFFVLKLQPPVSKPRDAVLFNNQLYVTCQNTPMIYKYERISE